MKPKRPNLRWKGNVAYYDHGGTPRRWERLGTNEKAVLERVDQLNGLRSPEHGTCDKMVADYLEKARDSLAPGTYRNYRVYRGHLAACFGPDEPHTITQRDVIQYLRTAGKLRTSARGEIGLLSLAFVNWMDEERLDFNPCFGVKVKGLRKSKRDRLITFAELDAVIGKADERMAIVIEFGYATGLRIDDLRTLRWADLTSSVWTRKTGARQGFQDTPEFRELVARARALQAKVASPFVFCTKRGKQWSYWQLHSRWDAACAAAGVEDAHFHDLRAIGATELDESEGIDAARQFLGHRNRQTTEVYIRGKRRNLVKPLVRRKA